MAKTPDYLEADAIAILALKESQAEKLLEATKATGVSKDLCKEYLETRVAESNLLMAEGMKVIAKSLVTLAQLAQEEELLVLTGLALGHHFPGGDVQGGKQGGGAVPLVGGRPEQRLPPDSASACALK